MEGSASARGRESATDLAYNILRSHGQAMYYKDLINEIIGLRLKEGENPGRLMAQIHTEINLDSRFHHQGGGQWGLREWSHKGGRVINSKPERTSKRQPSPFRLFEEGGEDEDESETEGPEAGEERDDDLFPGALEDSPEEDWE